MLLNIFKFYLLGLVIAFFVCLVIGVFCLGWRALRHLDKTVKERQGALYDAIMMSMVRSQYWHLLLWRFLSY